MEKTIMLGGNGRQQETRKTKSKMDRRTDSIEAAMSLSLQELSRAVEDRTLWTPHVRRVARSES